MRSATTAGACAHRWRCPTRSAALSGPPRSAAAVPSGCGCRSRSGGTADSSRRTRTAKGDRSISRDACTTTTAARWPLVSHQPCARVPTRHEAARWRLTPASRRGRGRAVVLAAGDRARRGCPGPRLLRRLVGRPQRWRLPRPGADRVRRIRQSSRPGPDRSRARPPRAPPGSDRTSFVPDGPRRGTGYGAPRTLGVRGLRAVFVLLER